MAAKVILRRHVSEEELERLYKEEKCPRTRERLLAIKLYYDGRREKEIGDILGRNIRTLRRWKKQWNEGGLEGLRYKQGKGGGRKPKLPEDIWEEIAKVAIAEAMDSKEVAVYIKDKYGIHYSHKTTWKKLRKDLGISFGKPYLLDKRKPKNAELILKKG